MSATVIELDRHRPHLSIPWIKPDGAVAVDVVPVDVALGWADGTAPLPEEGILRKIIMEWLLVGQAGCIAHAYRDLEDQA